ncbi:type VI secretion system Vgr family protein [Pantoea trifolii]|uniref:type VI secretion system Vgr family protein n=1 Tax=Pantoea trifolii TaxID=2968030 RepID=UPI003ED8E9BE
MNITDLLQGASSLINGTLNRYKLSIPSCSSSIDVENFNGTEALSENYHYDVLFTSPDKDITAAQMLRKPATLTMGTGELMGLSGQKMVHGYITDFHRLTGSADQVTYLIVIEPRLALLDKQYHSHRFFVNKSVPEVVSQILDEHGFQGWEYEFSLKHEYPKREQINQYQESDLQFIRRLLSEVGIFYMFTLQPDTQTEVVRFGDAQSALIQGKPLPLNSPSGLEDNGQESIWGLNITHKVVEAGVVAKDYNHREAQRILRSVPADMSRGDGDEINYGQVYHYRPRHPDSGDKYVPAPETANYYARLDHERFLCGQTLITGISNDASLAPGKVLTIIDGVLPTLPEQLQSPVVVTRIHLGASRKSALQINLNGVPYSETLCWRPRLLPRPKVSGTMTARVTSAKDNDIYAWQDASGLYRVVFDADEESKDRGQESMPVRLAKPYGGDMYGFHFPLIQGTEVAIAFREGDPDQPYIAHALHDSRHVDHVTEKNSTRNVIRTAGLNKLRMEDKRGEEHVKLSTEYGGKTQLNLGHNVDDDRLLRGEGAELRTDDWVAVRGGKGVFISADAQQSAQGRMMDMEEAIRQLKNALSLAKSLNEIAQKAEATQGDSDSHEELNNALEDLKQAGILAHAPEGIGIVSPKSVRMASGGASVGLMSGKNTDISAGESITLAATKTVSVFAQGEGMQLIAGAGKLDIQAQEGELNAAAQQDITISSAEGKVTVSAGQELTITCGGAYIKLRGGNIEMGAPGNILLKCANAQKMGPATLDSPPHTFPKGYGEGFTLKDSESGEIQPFTFYRVTTGEGEVYEGVSDEHGKTMRIFTAMPSALKIEFPDEEMTDIKEEK